MGALLLVVSDVIAQRLFPGNELPVGVVTVRLGGAYLVYLLVTPGAMSGAADDAGAPR